MAAAPADPARHPPHGCANVLEKMAGGAADGGGLNPAVPGLDELAGLNHPTVDHVELPHGRDDRTTH